MNWPSILHTLGRNLWKLLHWQPCEIFKWERATLAIASQLRNEPVSVTDIHFVPGNPRTFMGGVAWYF